MTRQLVFHELLGHDASVPAAACVACEEQARLEELAASIDTAAPLARPVVPQERRLLVAPTRAVRPRIRPAVAA